MPFYSYLCILLTRKTHNKCTIHSACKTYKSCACKKLTRVVLAKNLQELCLQKTYKSCACENCKSLCLQKMCTVPILKQLAVEAVLEDLPFVELHNNIVKLLQNYYRNVQTRNYVNLQT